MPEIDPNKTLANDYHVFTNNSDLLKQLNMQTFTTGTLFEFWHTKDENDVNYKFRKLFLNVESGREVSDHGVHWAPYEYPLPMFFIDQGDPDEPLEDLRGAGHMAASVASMEAWRFEDDNKGKFTLIPQVQPTQDQIAAGDEGWTWQDPREEIEWGDFDYDSLDLHEFIGKKVKAPIAEGEPPTLVDDDSPLIDPQNRASVSQLMDLLLQAPKMNDWIRYYQIYEPDVSTWDEKHQARREFLDDIKTSNSGCLSFSFSLIADVTPDYPDVFTEVPNPDYVPPVDDNGDPNPDHDPNVPETITDHTVSGACPIREDFTLNLYLKDELDDPEDDVAFAVQKMTRVGFAKDATGRPYGVKQNGDLTSPSESDEGTHIAAELDMHYNEYTGSYQSGNRTILAKITKTVGVAQAPNVEDLEGADNDETLNELTDNYIQMGTGEAMPITMQNGNPFQWTPNYATPADCRNPDDLAKQRVIVYNADPEKSFAVDKTVLLHEVDGKWFPLEFGSGEDPNIEPEPVFIGRWEFQQFITNAGNFFNYPSPGSFVPGFQGASEGNPYPYGNKPWSQQVSPTNAEKIFHRRYYINDSLNNGSASDITKYAGQADAFTSNDQTGYCDFNTLRASSYCRQITGFDYLEEAIGGTRGSQRSINRTLWATRGDNSTIPEDDNSSPNNSLYFGALFPDGYGDTNIDKPNQTGPSWYSTTSDRPFTVRAYQRQYDPNNFGGRVWDRATLISPRVQAFPQTKDEDSARDASRDAFRWEQDQFGNPDPNSPKISLFGDFVANKESTFAHLPADYATHCSPSGDFGRPITNMDALMAFDRLDVWRNGGLEQVVRNSFAGHNQSAIVIQTGVADPHEGPNDEDQSSMYMWAYKKPTAGWDLTDATDDANNPASGWKMDLSQSAFDFRPLRQNRIQFRPLVMEIVSNHSPPAGGTFDSQWPPTAANPRRNYIVNYLTNKMEDNQTALSNHSCHYLKHYFMNFETLYGTAKNLIFSDSYSHIGYGNVFKGERPHTEQFGQIIHDGDYPYDADEWYHNTNRVAPHNANAFFDYRRQSNQNGGQLAVGVIGSVCTVAANSFILYETQQQIGMQSWFLNGRWYPSWGGSSFDRYDKFGTTDLSARVYQAHPRDQLIYDSRFFAVHHFNPGTKLTTANPDVNNPDEEGITWKYADTDNDRLNDAIVHIEQSLVDIRVPSVLSFADDCAEKENHAASATYKPTRVPQNVIPDTAWNGNIGHIIYKDSVHGIPGQLGAGDDLETTHWNRLIPSGMWNVDAKRRGKLLPFNFTNLVMQSPFFGFDGQLGIAVGQVWAATEKMDNYDQLPQGVFGGIPALEVVDPNDPDKYITNKQPVSKVALVLKNLGSDYRVGDLFRIEGFENSRLKVVSVGREGCITGLQFDIELEGNQPKRYNDRKHLGTSVDVNRLIAANPQFVDPILCNDFSIKPRTEQYEQGKADITYITKSMTGNAQLKPFTKENVSGKGFQAYVTKATLRQLVDTDHKPKIATAQDYEQLTLPADTSQGGPAGFEPDNGFIEVTKGNHVAEMTITEKSPSGLYDIFLHFHNDTQHTPLNSDNMYATSNNWDQYVNLTITPN